MHAYEADFAGWADEQARALADRRFSDLDLEHLVEEVEELGGSYRDQLESWIIVLMMHLLKWNVQSEKRTYSWYLTIREQRRRLAKLLKKHPSLKPTVDDIALDSFEDAVEQAMDETKLLRRELFPAECPFKFEDLMTFPVSADETIDPSTITRNGSDPSTA